MKREEKKQRWKVEIPIEEYPNDYIEHCKKLYQINKDLVGHLMVWDDVDKVSRLEWMDFWKTVKFKRIRFRKMMPVKYRKKHVNMFEKYSMDELKKMYEDNYTLCAVTEYCILHLQKHKEHEIIDIDDPNTQMSFFLGIGNAKNKILYKRYRNETEKKKLIIKQYASEFIHNLLDEEEDCHSEMYDFVINNLQYASVEDLKQLLKLAKDGFVIKEKGRKSQNKKVFKYDLEHNLLNTYPNRNACIDAEQISKQALYNVLSGKRKTLKGFIYEEEK